MTLNHNVIKSNKKFLRVIVFAMFVFTRCVKDEEVFKEKVVASMLSFEC